MLSRLVLILLGGLSAGPVAHARSCRHAPAWILSQGLLPADTRGIVVHARHFTITAGDARIVDRDRGTVVPFTVHRFHKQGPVNLSGFVRRVA